MLPRVEGAADIRIETVKLLDAANARQRFPTPVDDLIHAAGLVEIAAQDSVLSPGALARAPRGIRNAIGKVAGRVRGLLDRREREVHLDPAIAASAHGAFVRLHEVGHKILPWQQALYEVDDDIALSQAARALFEQQASAAAADLLFQGEVFAEATADFEVGIAAVIDVSQRMGGSIRAGLRRYAETHRAEVCMITLAAKKSRGAPLRFRRHESVGSNSFVERFGDVFLPRELSVDQYQFICEAAGATVAPNRLFVSEWLLVDKRGERVTLRVELLNTTHNILVLAWVPFSQRTRRKLRLSR